MTTKHAVLIIDDDPTHLNIYCLILQQAEFHPVPVLVSFNGATIPEKEPIQAVLLDYCLTGTITACSVAEQIKIIYPKAPILILSDLPGMPPDIAPLAEGFVRKGSPEKLIAMLRELLGKVNAPNQKSGSEQLIKAI